MNGDSSSYRETASPKVCRAISIWTSPQETNSFENDENYEQYSKYVYKKWIFMLCCILVAILVMAVALTIGEFKIGAWESYKILWKHLFNPDNSIKEYVVVQLRLPRIFMGLVCGAGLAVCGAMMQSTLLNPLADPYTTGVSSGASFGATLAMTAGISFLPGYYAIIGNAFIFSLIPTAVIVAMAKMKSASPTTMIMAGIAIMYIFNAFTTVMMLMAHPNDLAAVYEWQVGSVSDCEWGDITIVGPIVLIGIIASIFLSRKLNVLATGDDMANSLGIDASKLRIIILILVSFMAASIVSFTGLIGFVGLVAPHIVRMFIGADNRYLIPASAIFGAMLLILADTIGRVIISPAVLQAGVIMAFLGGPMFLYLIFKQKKSVW